MADPLVSTDYLASRLGAADLSVVDATWYMPAEQRLGRDDYLKGHIPGAVFFDIDEIADKTVDLPHMLPTAEAFEKAAGALGLSPDHEVVVYDAQGLFSAPRVWWTLRIMGFRRVFVLDGGLPRWIAEGRPLETGAAEPKPKTFTAAFDPALVSSLEHVRAVVEDRSRQIVDARPAARFTAEAPEPRAGLRGGHMPGASCLPFSALLGPDGRLKPADELAKAFAEAGIDLDQPIITTCGSGVAASGVALALARLGHDRAAVYDGSWTEWGARGDTPVATGA
ncbi:3-mercaptopyruvate sulfurtransferase [Phenylobacterium sp.]|uniref:3-mercaptopyruvate sulfurtransferase n=1 Tax=Phenylobacterium sp. TaxID=1871053 RepID=UPI0035B32DCE